MPVELKEIISDYVLISYDIPACQGALRKRVLREMYEIGAIAHTQSVYLLPYSAKSLELANEISAGGSAYVFTSEMPNVDKAASISNKYAQHVKDRIFIINCRINKIGEHIKNQEFGRATKMIKKTKRLISQLKQIQETYNPPWLPALVEKLEEYFKATIAEK